MFAASSVSPSTKTTSKRALSPKRGNTTCVCLLYTSELAAFSAPEAELLKSLVLEERGDYSRLNKIAFRFLAGTHLTPFAESLRNWCFAASFNGGFTNPHEEFDDLVQFNRLDWADARTAILKAAELSLIHISALSR